MLRQWQSRCFWGFRLKMSTILYTFVLLIFALHTLFHSFLHFLLHSVRAFRLVCPNGWKHKLENHSFFRVLRMIIPWKCFDFFHYHMEKRNQKIEIKTTPSKNGNELMNTIQQMRFVGEYCTMFNAFAQWKVMSNSVPKSHVYTKMNFKNC